MTTMVAARMVGAGAVVSFEANPLFLLPVIRNNAERNGLSLAVENRVLLPSRLAVMRHHVRFHPTGDFWAGHVLADDEPCDEAILVPTADFDATLAAFGANALIMDIEGFEIDLLENAKLEGIDKIIVEIYYDRAGRDRTDAAIMALLQRGYRRPGAFGARRFADHERAVRDGLGHFFASKIGLTLWRIAAIGDKRLSRFKAPGNRGAVRFADTTRLVNCVRVRGSEEGKHAHFFHSQQFPWPVPSDRQPPYPRPRLRTGFRLPGR